MGSEPLSIRTTQTFALAASAWLSGGMSAISLLAIPALRRPSKSGNLWPPTLAQQFQTMYGIGRLTQPPATLATALSFFYLAYRAHGNAAAPVLPHATAAGVQAWQLWAGGGAAVLAALWPFTFVVLEPVSQRLLVWAETSVWEEREPDEAAKEVQTLLYRWGVLNMVRACLPAVGAACGFWAVFFVSR